MKTSIYSLIIATLVLGVVNVTAFAATPAASRSEVRALLGCTTADASPEHRTVAPDNRSDDAFALSVPADAALVDYLAWHGRVAVGSALTELMPWAALYQNAD